MKIMHAVLSRDFYGSERYCIELACAQARRGHDVEVVIEGAGTCARVFSRAIGATPGRIHLRAMPRWLPAWLQRPWARRELRRFRPDIVHSHLNPAARRIGASAQALGIAHVMTLHLDYDAREHAFYDGLIALTSTQRRRVPAEFAGPVAVIWNWLPSAFGTADGGNLRAAWQAGADTVVFGSVGRLVPEKGMDRLVRAFRAAFPPQHRVRLVIAGAGEQQAELAQLVGQDSRILLAGHQSEIARFYRAFDVFVSAARVEPFGLAILEAMSAGCPLVLPRISGPADFMTDARVRWFKPDDDADLSVNLRAAAARGRERFIYDMTPFAEQRALQEIESFYRQVIAKSHH